MPRGGTWWYRGGLGPIFFRNSTRFGVSAPGALGRGQKFNFLNMVMWHIKLKGMSNRPGYTAKNFNLRSNWRPWDGVKASITIRFLAKRGDLRWRAIECVLTVYAVAMATNNIPLKSKIQKLHFRCFGANLWQLVWTDIDMSYHNI